jgi:CubicO group peptidase (beta-lactamase class C family)
MHDNSCHLRYGPSVFELTSVLLAGTQAAPRPLCSAAVALIRRAGRTVTSATAGELVRYADDQGAPAPAGDRRPATESSIFDLASITKLFTTTVLLTLVDDGVLALDEPLGRWLPSFRGGERELVTLRRLLNHTSGLPALLRLWTDYPDRESRARAVLETPLVNRPGTAFEYSCVGFLVAGLLAEHVTGRGLADLVDERVCRPLGLTDTGFLPGPDRIARTAATEYKADIGRGMVRGVVHDENSWSLGGTGGNAGVFGTAADVARFGEMLRQGGALDGVRVLSEDTVAEMTRDQLPASIDPGFRHGLGVRIGDPNCMGKLAGDDAVGHTGFTGTLLVVDRSRDLVIVLLTNRVHPSRGWSDVGELRRTVCSLAAQI